MSFEDRYQLQVPLGETDRGTVWSAKDTKFGRNVAVAVLEDDVDEEVATRFKEVNEAAKELRHAGLVRVHDVGETAEGAPFAAMELLEGESLRKRLIEGPPLRLDQAVRAIAEILSGLGTLHAAGAAHGDVCPSNIIVRERSGRVAAKLMGLGLCRARIRAGKEPLDVESQLFGLAFMSPAQARGETVADPASDIYSAAAILYALLTGHLPHHGETEAELREDVKSRAVWSADRMRHEIAGPIADAVTRALGDEPFESAEELAKELRGSLLRMRGVGKLETVAGKPSLTRPDGAPPEAPTEKRQSLRPPMAKLSLTNPTMKKSGGKLAGGGGAPLEFDNLSGLIEITNEGGIPKRVPATPATPASSDDGLEFERLSGLLEVPRDGTAPKRVLPAPPPPPKPKEPDRGEDADPPAADGTEEADEEADAREEKRQGEDEQQDGDEGKLEDAEKPEEGEEKPEEEGEPTAGPEVDVEEPAGEEAAADADQGEPVDGDMTEPAAEEVAASAESGEESSDAAPAAPGGEPPREPPPPGEPGVPDPFAARVEPPPPGEPGEPDPFAAPVEGEAPTREPSKGGVPVKVWVAIAAVVILGIGSRFIFGGEPDEPETQPISTPPHDEGPEVGVDDRGAGTQDVEVPDVEVPDVEVPDVDVPDVDDLDDDDPGVLGTVEEPDVEPTLVTLTGVPEGATVWLDGARFEGAEVAIPADGASHDIAVRLAGHSTWRRSVNGTASRTIAVVLERSGSAPSTSPGTGRHRPRGERGTSGRGRPTAVRDPGF